MNMGNLWQFFGLPDPDASVAPRTQETSAQQTQTHSENTYPLVDVVICRC